MPGATIMKSRTVIRFVCIWSMTLTFFIAGLMQLTDLDQSKPIMKAMEALNQTKPLMKAMKAVDQRRTDTAPFVHREFTGPKPRPKTRQSGTRMSLFCLVLTSDSTSLKFKAVNNTWARRCNKTVFFSDRHENVSDVVYLNSFRLGRQHLTEKVVKAFQYVKSNFANYDWFLKADDDTYIIVDNLRVLLSYFHANDPVYLGQNFKYFTKQGYHSGGAGYVMSKEALDRFISGVENGTCVNDGNDEDVDVGICLESQGVVAYDSTDNLKRETFHAGTMDEHIVGPKSPLLMNYPSMEAQVGRECCSSLTTSFHYVSPTYMHIIDMLLYHITVHGRHFNASFDVFG